MDTEPYYICNIIVAARIMRHTQDELDMDKKGVFKAGFYDGMPLYVDTNIADLSLTLISGSARKKVYYEED